MSSILKVDTINENSSGGGVTIDGLKIKDVSAGSVMSKPILQIVTGTTATDTGVQAETSYTDTGLSASITPTSTSSKIMVMVWSYENQVKCRDIIGFVARIDPVISDKKTDIILI